MNKPMTDHSKEWSGGNQVGRIYKLTEDDNARLGDYWMSGRLRNGDFALCTDHTGDGFYNYILLEVGDNYIKGIPESSFGSYAFLHEPIPFQTNNSENSCLMAGSRISIRDTHKEWAGFKDSNILKPIAGLSNIEKQESACYWLVYPSPGSADIPETYSAFHKTREAAERLAEELVTANPDVVVYVAKLCTRFASVTERFEMGMP